MMTDWIFRTSLLLAGRGAERVVARPRRSDAFRGSARVRRHDPPRRGSLWECRIADADQHFRAPDAEHFRDDLRYGRPDAAADVSDAGAALDAAVVVDEHFGGRRRSVEVVPDALREPDAALHRPRVRARFHLARLCPADLLRADAALLAPRRMRIVPVAQLERIHPQLV